MHDYQYFGVMLDVSRNAVLRVDELKRIIDLLQKMGYNALELYAEDTLEIQNEPMFGYLRGRYSAAEIQEIDAYAQAHGVELIPCIQTLGHFTNLVKVPEYGSICDIADILLIDEPRTYELIENIFRTLADNFTSRRVNIGMDEAFQVGLGRYLKKHGFCDRHELLLRHLNKVVDIATKYGFKPHMWGDMFFRLASATGEYYNVEFNVTDEIKRLVPENIELVYWDYYTKEQEKYEKNIAGHEAFGRPVWFAGGAWRWIAFAPNNGFSLRTSLPAFKAVNASKIKNVLITSWGDDGGECSFYATLPSIYAIRRFADGVYDLNTIEKEFYELFQLRFSDFMLLDLPNEVGGQPKDYFGSNAVRAAGKSLLYNDIFLGYIDKAIMETPHIPYAEYAEKIADAAQRAGEYAYVFDTLAKLCKVLDIKTELGIRTRQLYQAGDKQGLQAILSDYDELSVRLEDFYNAFQYQWDKENKPHGWEVQDARLGGLMRRVKTCATRLRDYLAGKRPAVEELEEKINLSHESGGLGYNQYRRIVTVSNL